MCINVLLNVDLEGLLVITRLNYIKICGHMTIKPIWYRINHSTKIEAHSCLNLCAVTWQFPFTGTKKPERITAWQWKNSNVLHWALTSTHLGWTLRPVFDLNNAQIFTAMLQNLVENLRRSVEVIITARDYIRNRTVLFLHTFPHIAYFLSINKESHHQMC